MKKVIDRAQVLECIKQGMSNREVAQTVGCSIGWVSTLRRELNVEAKHGRPRINRDRVAECISRGLTLKQTADEIGCSEIAVSKIKQELKLSKRQPIFPFEEYLALRQKKLTNLQLSKKLNISVSTIYKYQSRLGLTKNPSHKSKYQLFDDMFSSGMTRQEIIESLKISHASYYNYRTKYLHTN